MAVPFSRLSYASPGYGQALDLLPAIETYVFRDHSDDHAGPFQDDRRRLLRDRINPVETEATLDPADQGHVPSLRRPLGAKPFRGPRVHRDTVSEQEARSSQSAPCDGASRT